MPKVTDKEAQTKRRLEEEAQEFMRETQALLQETQARTSRLVETIERQVAAREAGAR